MDYHLLIFVIAYLLGTIPFAFLAGKLKNIDLREHGSGNMGATNAYRILGKKWGIFVLLGDAVKGGLAAYIGLSFYGPWGGVAGGLLAMLGHSFNPYFGFKPSGKGVASGLGIICVLMPRETIAALIVFILVVAITRYVSLGSLTGSLTVLITVFFFEEPPANIFFTVIAVSLVIWLHRKNIERIIQGTEPKFGKKNTEE